MRIGLGLPIADPTILPEWARRADAGPFSTLGLLDRLVYDNPEPLVTLAALAGITTRVNLQTEVLLAPLRDTALLAKQAATLHRLSGGRLILGVGVGGRADDHEASGTELRTRGRRLDEQLGLMRKLWAGAPYSDTCGPIGPSPDERRSTIAPYGGTSSPRHTPDPGPELLFGGFQPAALERVGRWGGKFLCAAPPSWAGGLIETARRSWREHGRPGEPRVVAQVNAAIGPDSVVEQATSAMRAYYEFSGRADFMVEGMITSADGIRSAITRFADLGADELIFYCYGTDPDQVDRIADIVG
ncbi:LLM class flavin-dependent oxidoreductase [Nocardia sp. NPDC003482]